MDRLLREPGWRRCSCAAPRGRRAWPRSARRSRPRAPGGPDRPEDWAAEIRERAGRAAPVRACARCSTPPASCCTPTSAARRWPTSAVQAMAPWRAGYSNLEFDLDTGARGSRTDHCRELAPPRSPAPRTRWWSTTPPARSSSRSTRWPAGRDVLISRGELIEIGGSFRIPDIMGRSGARLREVGTTNRTHLDDYRRALGRRGRRHPHGAPLQLRAARASWPRPSPAALAALAAEAGVPYLFDVGQRAAGGSRAVGAHRPSRGWPTRSAAGRRPRDLQRRQAAGRAAGRLPRGPAGAARALPREPVRARHARGQADPRGARGHAGALRGSRDGRRARSRCSGC